jgi:hypothetical protein
MVPPGEHCDGVWHAGFDAMSYGAVLRSANGAMLRSLQGAKCVMVPAENLTEIKTKIAWLRRFGYRLAFSCEQAMNASAPILNPSDIAPYEYNGDGSYRKFRHVVIKNTCTPDPGPPFGERSVTQFVALWVGLYSDDPSPPPNGTLEGSGVMGIPGYGDSVAISSSSGSFYASTTKVWEAYGITYTTVTEFTFTEEESLTDTAVRAAALYSACPALTRSSGGIYTYDSTGAIVSGAADATASANRGHFSSGYRGMFGHSADAVDTTQPDVIGFCGAVYAVSASAWYIQTKTFDLDNAILSTVNTSQGQKIGYYTLEDLTSFSESKAIVGSP